ncbi:MAG: hypothetical protein EBX55_01090 [Betaproteobacteria bacterium]|nr:hypothetical protein [Betaproteobacteria bacterium]
MGNGRGNPDVESQLIYSEFARVERPCGTVTETFFENNFVPLVPHLARHIQNPSNLVPEVAANGWIEGTTVGSIILGTVLGGVLISPAVSDFILAFDFPGVHSPATAAIVVIGGLYLLAALINLRIPDTGARYEKQHTNPLVLIGEFWQCNLTLWRDKLGQISLAVTSATCVSSTATHVFDRN